MVLKISNCMSTFTITFFALFIALLISFWRTLYAKNMYIGNFARFIFINRLPTPKNRLVDEAGFQGGGELMKKC